MIIYHKPRIDRKLQKIFDRFIDSTSKKIPFYSKFLKTISNDETQLFLDYFSFKTKTDLKDIHKKLLRFRNNKIKKIEIIIDLVFSHKDKKIWKQEHEILIRGIELGNMYQIQYKKYKHDPYPLVIFLNDYDHNHQNFQAINLHYLQIPLRKVLIETILKVNSNRIKQKKSMIVTMDILNNIIPMIHIVLRNYKASEIKVIEKINISQWKTHLEIDKHLISYK